MTGDERKRAFKVEAMNRGENLSVAAITSCGVTWEHLGRGLSDDHPTTLSDDVKRKYCEYVGVSMDAAFGDSSKAA